VQLLPGIEQADFICGCGHSGTTLLATILSVHPQLHVPLYETEAFRKPDTEITDALLSLAETGRAAGKTHVVEKTPRHILELNKIRALLPGARFLIMVRDGRDVVGSIANRLGGDFQHGLKRWIHETGVALEERSNPDVMVIRYETLIDDPAGTIAGACSFLDVPYFDDLLEYHRTPHLWYGKDKILQADGTPGTHEDLRNWQVNQPIFDNRGERRKTVPTYVLAQFSEGRALEIMQAFGYADTIDPTDEQSLSIGDRVAAWVLSRGLGR
jgi:hypothetical protein